MTETTCWVTHIDFRGGFKHATNYQQNMIKSLHILFFFILTFIIYWAWKPKEKEWQERAARRMRINPLPLSKVIPNSCFVETLSFVEESSNVLAGILQQVILNKKLDPLEKKAKAKVEGLLWSTFSIIKKEKKLLPFWGPCWISFGPWLHVCSSAYSSCRVKCTSVVLNEICLWCFAGEKYHGRMSGMICFHKSIILIKRNQLSMSLYA